MITVSYLFEADKDDFWDKSTGDLREPIEEKLHMLFPNTLNVSDDLSGGRQHLSYRIIDHSNANLLTCPICKCLITDTSKPNPIPTLRQAKELEGVLMCSSCAWEQGFDVLNGTSIEDILDRFK